MSDPTSESTEKKKGKEKPKEDLSKRPPFVVPTRRYEGPEARESPTRSTKPSTSNPPAPENRRGQYALASTRRRRRAPKEMEPQEKEEEKKPDEKTDESEDERPIIYIDKPEEKPKKETPEKPEKPKKVKEPEEPEEKPSPFFQGNIPSDLQPRFYRTARDQDKMPKKDEPEEKERSPKPRRSLEQQSPQNKRGLDEACPTGDGPVESLETEFMYYASALKELTPMLTDFKTKRRVFEWIDKLYQPAYFTSPLILKRNLYLFQLVLMCINDELYGNFFRPPPPAGEALPQVDAWRPGKTPKARWERNQFWKELFEAAVEEIDDRDQHILECYYHGEQCQNDDEETGQLLDEEFKFFLHVIQPYLKLVEDQKAKLSIALWLQLLSRVQPSSCTIMKGIRNDYMQALVGYVQDERLVGPFQNPPEQEYLVPLEEAVEKQGNDTKHFSIPTGNEVERFVIQQPQPKSGAFCFIAVSGDMQKIDSSVPNERKQRKMPFSAAQNTGS